jgi:phosphatidylglycerol:prolipoprotein diacylglycerol transferase
MEYWRNIYSEFNPIAFTIGVFDIHWYSLMYITSILVTIYMITFIVKNQKLNISKNDLNSYFIYAEIGVILGARLGYILFYSDYTSFYLLHPWHIFNPFDNNGNFIGIRGMSYHGALLGFIISTYIYSMRHKKNNFWFMMDLVAISLPLGYIFGRIGNFLNKELIGKTTQVPWGIYIDGVLRHPSQLYEAFLEGVIVFIIVYMYSNKKRFDGKLVAIYGISYSIARYISEIYREPDVNLGEIIFGMSMGQILSIIMLSISIFIYFILKNSNLDSKKI